MCLRNLKNSEPILTEQDIEVYKTIYADKLKYVEIIK